MHDEPPQLQNPDVSESGIEVVVTPRAKEKKSKISQTFDDLSRPIGLILLGVFGFVEFGLDKEINDLYLIIVGLLLAGDKLTSALRR